jgi:hypothetical protein
MRSLSTDAALYLPSGGQGVTNSTRALAGTNKYSSVTRRVEKLLHALPWPNCSREEDLFRLNSLEATSRSALVDRAPRRGQGAPETRRGAPETRRGAKVWQS